MTIQECISRAVDAEVATRMPGKMRAYREATVRVKDYYCVACRGRFEVCEYTGAVLVCDCGITSVPRSMLRVLQ